MSQIMYPVRAILFSAVLAVAATVAHAEPVYNNMEQGSAGALSVDGNNPLAASFLTPNWGDRIESIQIALSGDNTDSGVMIFSLVEDDAADVGQPFPNLSDPTAVLATETIPDLGSTLDTGVVSFDAAVGVSLQPNTRYWVVVDENPNNPTSAMWSYEATVSDPTVTNEWLELQNAESLPNNELPLAFQMNVQTPEPASLALMGAGLVALGIGRRLRKGRADATSLN